MRLREKKKKKKENRDKNTVNEIISILQRNKVCVLGFIMGLKVSKGFHVILLTFGIIFGL